MVLFEIQLDDSFLICVNISPTYPRGRGLAWSILFGSGPRDSSSNLDGPTILYIPIIIKNSTQKNALFI